MTDPNDDMLNDLFAQARRVKPKPSDALVARVLASAEPPTAVVRANRPRMSARLLDIIGGWPAVGGLMAATLVGLWIGIAPPAAVEDLTAMALGEPVTVGVFAGELAFDVGAFIDG